MRDDLDQWSDSDPARPFWKSPLFWVFGIPLWIAALWFGVVFGAEPTTDWPESVAVGELLILDAPEASENVAWSVYPADTIFRIVDANHAIVIETAAPGVVIVALADGSDPLTVTQAAIVIGDGGPGPGPLPPTTGKLHVLLLYETDASEPGHLTQEQSGILAAVPILEYLDSHCADEDGQPAYRFLDDDADTSNLAEDWQEVIARGLSAGERSLPWLIVASDRGGSYEGKLPDDVDGMLELLKRFGGE